jgi:hypothetical protein
MFFELKNKKKEASITIQSKFSAAKLKIKFIFEIKIAKSPGQEIARQH